MELWHKDLSNCWNIIAETSIWLDSEAKKSQKKQNLKQAEAFAFHKVSICNLE